MIESFVKSNNNIRYLYALKKITNIIKFLLSEYIRNLLKIVIIFNYVRYLHSYILIKISFINKIKNDFF